MSMINYSPEDNIKIYCKIIRKLFNLCILFLSQYDIKERMWAFGGGDLGVKSKLLVKLISKEVEYQFEGREDLSDKVIFEQRHEGFEEV